MSAPTTRTILVLGSTGPMAGEVIRSLNERGVTPRALVRNPSRLRQPTRPTSASSRSSSGS